MSTRHVWDKYTTGTQRKLSDFFGPYYSVDSRETTVIFFNEYGTDEYGNFKIVGNTYPVNVTSTNSPFPVNSSDYKYAYLSRARYSGTSFDDTFVCERSISASKWKVAYFAGSNYDVCSLAQYDSSNTAVSYNIAKIVYEPVKGTTKEGQVSSADTSAYPNDGVSGSYWYTKIGSDNVDPLSVTYDKETIERGETLKVIVEPREYAYEWNIGAGPLHAGRYYDKGTCVAYGGIKFVAIPGNYYEDETPGTAAYSTDGVNWSNTTIPVSGLYGYNQIAYGNNKFVAVGSKSACSSDGTSWEEMRSYPGNSQDGWLVLLSGVAFGNGKFVGFESSSPSGNLGAYTTDCETWNLIIFPLSANWKYIAYGSNKFVLLGNSGETIYSEDGLAWNIGSTISITSPNALKYCNNKFYVLPSDKTNNAYCSEDGVNWTVANIPNDCAWISMAYGNGKYILISEYDGTSPTKYAISDDGETWEVNTVDINGTDDNGLVYGGNKFVCFEAYGNKVASYSKPGFGGTISYQYQVSGDGGSTWYNEGAATTSTTKNITVPNNATQISARVRAQDGWGFVSETYVRGPNLSVTLIESDYLLFAGGYGSNYVSNVDAYNSNLTHSTPESLIVARYRLSASSVGEHALFGGGYGTGSSNSNVVDSYDKTLTHTTLTVLPVSALYLSASNVENYALFAGGLGNNNVMLSSVTAYNKSLSQIVPSSLSSARYRMASASTGDYAFFGGGASGTSSTSIINTVDAYNKSLSRTILEPLSAGREDLFAVSIGDRVLFAGGTKNNGSTYSNYTSNIVDMYDKNLTRSTITELSVARSYLSGTHLGNYAIFAGGANEVKSANPNSVTSYTGAVDVYDSTLTRTINTDLSLARGELSAGTVGTYALFAGGTSGTASDIVDVYRHI